MAHAKWGENEFRFGAVRITGEYVALKKDVYTSSIIRFVPQITLKSQHIHTCMAQFTLRNGCGKVYEIEQQNNGHVSNLSSVSVANVEVKFNKSIIMQKALINHIETWLLDC